MRNSEAARVEGNGEIQRIFKDAAYWVERTYHFIILGQSMPKISCTHSPVTPSGFPALFYECCGQTFCETCIKLHALPPPMTYSRGSSRHQKRFRDCTQTFYEHGKAYHKDYATGEWVRRPREDAKKTILDHKFQVPRWVLLHACAALQPTIRDREN